ncbi:MAG: GNAT family N-acetyltransferase [Desulfobulbaceae bacterium]|nr:GNAT family N-acetyltransferase [Desulfobulbaceae bacterium]
MENMILRPLGDKDVPDFCDMLYSSFNAWYWKHGWGRNYFSCRPQETAIFFDIYNDLTPDCNVAVFDSQTGRLMGSCFYHPREHHVSLGIMSVHPNYFGRGVGKALIDQILAFVRSNNYRSCRLVGSAINMDSFSLYNRAGFVPRVSYHDMVLTVPQAGMAVSTPGEDRVRDAVHADVQGMGELEMAVSSIRREVDYRYAIDNPRGCLHASVHENDQGGIDGFMLSLKHPALNMLGPCVAASEEIAVALIRRELDRFRGEWALFLIPMDKRQMVETMYEWGARNVETHLKQVWGHFVPIEGVSMPSFLPETG